MKQITLYVYQSIDGCTARADKQVDDAVLNADCLLLDEETYLNVFMNHLGWPLTDKDTFVVAKAGCNLTEKEKVRFITGGCRGGTLTDESHGRRGDGRIRRRNCGYAAE